MLLETDILEIETGLWFLQQVDSSETIVSMWYRLASRILITISESSWFFVFFGGGGIILIWMIPF